MGRLMGKCEFPDYPIRERAYAVGQRQPGIELLWCASDCMWVIPNPSFEERCWMYLHRREMTATMLLKHIPRACRREYARQQTLSLWVDEQ
jgi:hypothetical protein